MDVKRASEWLTLHFHSEGGDRDRSGRVRFASSRVNVRLARHVDIHPDLLALAALLCVRPWAASLTLSWGVSPDFAETAVHSTGIAVGPVDAGTRPRIRPRDGVPGLCYSGGTDCSAALTVLPIATRSYFLSRISPEGGAPKGSYSKSAALNACEMLRQDGRAVRVVDTDMQYIRKPVGFPHSLSIGVPAILHADYDQLDSIGWGTVLESAYGVGRVRGQDYTSTDVMGKTGRLLHAVGLPIFNAVSGVSEVGTSMIVRNSPYGEFAQSCVRGDIGAPCRNCWKCTRKGLLDAALSSSWDNTTALSALLLSPETVPKLRKEPLKHENVVSYVAAQYPEELRGDGSVLSALLERVRVPDVQWMEHWYTPAADLFPQPYGSVTSERLDEQLNRMGNAEIQKVENWSMEEWLNTEERKLNSDRFAALLTEAVEKKGS